MSTEAPTKIVATLNSILEHELAGVVRYTHYSFMVFGANRIPIVKWLREQASESLAHAQQIGEFITSFDAHPSLKIAKLLETEKHSIQDILKESLDHEKTTLAIYYELLKMTEGKQIALEEFARHMISQEEMHISEVGKMLRSGK
jgi:bacterioferritin